MLNMNAVVSVFVIQYPTGRFGYVGSVPKACCNRVVANKSAIMGGRYVREEDDVCYEYPSMVFDSQKDAVDFASSVGHTAKLPLEA